MNRTSLGRWLGAPPPTGGVALVGIILAVGVPTAVRAAVSGMVTGCEFTPYLPFVLIGAVFLRWWQASAIAVTSVAIMGGVFQGTALHVMPCFLSAAGMFLAASALTIAVASVARRALAWSRSRLIEDPASGIRFSVDRGEVWASWNGQSRPLRLGSQLKVAARMKDFLAEAEPGRQGPSQA